MLFHGNLSRNKRRIAVVLNITALLIIVILVLILIYGFALLEKGPIDVVMAVALFYLSHLLPASVLGWTEKEF